ncbi:MAG: helix-turn-helix domain-containing protein [Oscillospiraceae bacterium]|jgi:predicted ArsR family transcriptional regulator|nr:helix-turn-helix domain-containing protein [Oscillospiraceae bacterium]
MEKKIITLNDENSLKIYMNPLRQRMFLTLITLGEPITSKKLADRMKIAPSSAKYHLEKLRSIGLVEIDHTEQIHGITATFYKRVDAEVQMKVELHTGEERSWKAEKLVGENMVRMIYQDYFESIDRQISEATKSGRELSDKDIGTQVNGVTYMTQAEAEKLREQIMDFLRTHGHDKKDKEGALPFEFSLIAFPAQRNPDSTK